MFRLSRISTVIGLMSLVALAAPPASAAEGSPDGRSGFTFGAALGGGHLGCAGPGCDDELNPAFSIDAHIGGMLAARAAILFDVWWMFHTENKLTVSQGLLTGALRFWPINHFWVQGGLGVARAGYSYDSKYLDFEDYTEWVPAFQLGIGVEPIATETFGLDVALRYGTGFYSDGDYHVHNLALTVGVSFY